MFWKLSRSLADFFQKFIMEAVSDHWFTISLGCKTASGWKYDPKYLQCCFTWEDGVTVQWHHVQSPSHIVEAVLVVYETSRQVWINSCYSDQHVLLQFTKFLHSIITYFKTFNSKQRNIHGLIQELYYLLHKFMAVHTQFNSFSLILHIISLAKSFLQIKNKE